MRARLKCLLAAALLLMTMTGCDAPERSGSSTQDAAVRNVEPALKTVIDLRDLPAMPDAYAWVDFRPNVKKLILAGVPESKHVAILWYTTQDGGVGLHYHANTESVYVIDGSQTDAKGVYPSGSVYFNPPNSGHQITKSHGFFLLAYASPPDFAKTALIGEYTPVRIDTLSAELFPRKGNDVSVYTVPLDPNGGMKAQLTEAQSTAELTYTGNYVLVVRGSCVIDGITHGPSKLVVTKTVERQQFKIARAAVSGSCSTLGVSF
jgi:hypothetical protein